MKHRHVFVPLVFVLSLMASSSQAALQKKFVGEIFIQGQQRLDQDLDPIFNGAEVLLTPSDPKSSPLQTSKGWGGSITWLALSNWSLSLEGGLAKGRTRILGDRPIITDFVRDPITSEFVPVTQTFFGDLDFSSRLSWISFWVGRRTPVIKGFEGWIEAGPLFAKSGLRADFLGSFQGPQTVFDALQTSLNLFNGDYKANLFGVGMRLRVSVMVTPWIGFNLAIGYNLFQPRPWVRQSDGQALPLFDENFLRLDEFSKSNPSGVILKGSVTSPWSF